MEAKATVTEKQLKRTRDPCWHNFPLIAVLQIVDPYWGEEKDGEGQKYFWEYVNLL